MRRVWRHPDANADGKRNGNGNTNSYANANTDTGGNSDSYTYGNSDTYRHSNVNAYTNADRVHWEMFTNTAAAPNSGTTPIVLVCVLQRLD